MPRSRGMQSALTTLVWRVGSRVPHWTRRLICTIAPWPISVLPLDGLRQWEINTRTALGREPTKTQRRELVSSWLNNNLMSLSLARWSDSDILDRVIISDGDLRKLRTSLAGPGLVLALPHMGSWDFAGAWCARVGIKVMSVAEKLPRGIYERFRDARAKMGMDILPVDQPDLMRSLVESVRRGDAVCLLSDRDLSGRGVQVPWPGSGHMVHVPAGPAILARLSGCDMRAAFTRFHGDQVQVIIGDVINVGSPAEMMTAAVAQFAEGVRSSPTDWLMLQPFFKDA